jgi:hypothetical protein
VKKPEWQSDWATAAFRNFGNFRLILDTEPPLIQVPGITENANLENATQIIVIVRDNNKKIKNFHATLDGNWLMFSNDKARAYIYKFDEHCSKGHHELKIYAEDEAGNSVYQVIHFIR